MPCGSISNAVEGITASLGLELNGMAPVCQTVAPGRCNLIGEHVDYVGGRVLPAALPVACFVTVFRLPQSSAASSKCVFVSQGPTPGQYETSCALFDDCMTSLSDAKAHLHSQIAVKSKNFQTFTIAAVIEALNEHSVFGCSDEIPIASVLGGLAVFIEGNVPLGAGLSSSASLCVALVMTITTLLYKKQESTTQAKLSAAEKIAVTKAARRIENDYCGVACGIMDQFASVHGEEGCFLEVNCDTLQYQTHSIKSVLGTKYQFILVNSMNAHSLGSEFNNIRTNIEGGQHLVGVESGLGADFLFCNHVNTKDSSGGSESLNLLNGPIRSKLTEAQHRCSTYVVEEMIRTQHFIRLVEESRTSSSSQDAIVKQLGMLLNQTHEGLSQQLRVSTEELDFIQQTCCGGASPMAVGGRLMGGGFGGCCILLVERSKLAELVSVLQSQFNERFGSLCDVYPIDRLADGAAATWL